MTTEIAIRPATIADYAGIAVVFSEIELLHRQALPYIFRATDGPALERDFFEAQMADEEAIWLVVEQAGEIAGFAFVRILYAPNRPMLVQRRYAYVENLAVRVSAQRSGIGRALIQRAEGWAREHEVDEIELNVWEFNAGAIAFYQELGYVTERRTMRRVIDNVNS
jgi:ribosomal protein S18 acetylase RimI-like enzyme